MKIFSKNSFVTDKKPQKRPNTVVPPYTRFRYTRISLLRGSAIVEMQMEDLLIIWIQDLTHKRIPLDTSSIRQQALDFFNHLEEKNPTEFQFSASKGWFERFKDRFSIRNVKFTG